MTEPKMAYQVLQRDQRHVVADENGQEVVVCGDARSAEHYAALLGQAYQRGYKRGYHEARAASG